MVQFELKNFGNFRFVSSIKTNKEEKKNLTDLLNNNFLNGNKDFSCFMVNEEIVIERITPQFPHTGQYFSAIDKIRIRILHVNDNRSLLVIDIIWRETFIKLAFGGFVSIIFIYSLWPLSIGAWIAFLFIIFIGISFPICQIHNTKSIIEDLFASHYPE